MLISVCLVLRLFVCSFVFSPFPAERTSVSRLFRNVVISNFKIRLFWTPCHRFPTRFFSHLGNFRGSRLLSRGVDRLDSNMFEC